MRFLLALSLLLFTGLTSAQQLSTEFVYPEKLVRKNINISPNLGNASTHDDVKFRGYVYEQSADTEKIFKIQHSRSVNYQSENPELYWLNEKGEVLTKLSFGLDPASEPRDLVSFVLPGIVNEMFLRMEGDGERAMLWRKLEEKKDGVFVEISGAADRVQMPFGYVYANHYSNDNKCPVSYNFKGQGVAEGETWSHTQLITLTDCNTGGVMEEYRELRKLNKNRKQLLFSIEKKVNNEFVEESRQEFVYDENSKLVEQSEITSNSKIKYLFQNDPRGFTETEKYEWENEQWIKKSRTIKNKETMPDGSEKIELARETLLNDQWTAFQKEEYEYDIQGRETFARLQQYNFDTKEWVVRDMVKTKYHSGDLISEIISIDETSGSKVEGIYNIDNKLIESISYSCEGCVDDFIPAFHAYYHDFGNDQIDYWKSDRWNNGQWTKNDSLANSYNEYNLLDEMFFESYPEKVAIRYRFNYEENITDVGDDVEEFSIYPNPTNGILKIRLSNIDDSFRASLMGMKGESVKVHQQSNEIDLTQFPDGIYLLRVDHGSKSFYKRVVLSR